MCGAEPHTHTKVCHCAREKIVKAEEREKQRNKLQVPFLFGCVLAVSLFLVIDFSHVTFVCCAVSFLYFSIIISLFFARIMLI